jgi:hypothetical protein
VKNLTGHQFAVKVLSLTSPCRSVIRGNTFQSCVSVEISYCTKSFDLEIFNCVRSLTLNDCDQIISLAALRDREITLEYVAVRSCGNITDFRPLCAVPHVVICLHLNQYTQSLGISQAILFCSFQGLQDVRTLEIRNLMNDQVDLTPLLLGNNKTLILSGTILTLPV